MSHWYRIKPGSKQRKSIARHFLRKTGTASHVYKHIDKASRRRFK